MKPVLAIIVLVISLLLLPLLFDLFSNPPDDLFGTIDPPTRTATLLTDYVVTSDSNLSLNNVPDLGIFFETCTIYYGEARLYMDSENSSGGLKYDFDFPPDAAAIGMNETWSQLLRQTSTLSADITAATAVKRFATVNFHLESFSSGILQLRFAQNTAFASDSTLLTGTHFWITRVGPSLQLGC